MLQLWHDGLQAVLAAYLASRRFTTEAHADWLRSVMVAVAGPEADAAVSPKQVPALFAAANVSPSAEVLDAAVRSATDAPLRYAQAETLLADLLEASSYGKSYGAEASSSPVGALFRQYASGGQRLTLAGWTRFCKEEQGEEDANEAAP